MKTEKILFSAVLSAMVAICLALPFQSASAASSVETVRLADGNVFYGGDGGTYRIRNESFLTSPAAVKWSAIEIIAYDGRKLYLPRGELLLAKLPTKIDLLSYFPGATYLETNDTSAWSSSSISGYYVKDGYYWFVPYATDADGKFSVTVLASPYKGAFPDTGLEKYADCTVVYDESFLEESDTMNLSCGGAPIPMFATNDPVLDGIADKEAFVKRLAKDFNLWDDTRKGVLARNAGVVVSWLRGKAESARFSDANAGYAFLMSLKYDEATRKAIDASTSPADLQKRLGKLDKLTHSGLYTLISGTGVCDGISTAGFYLYQISGKRYFVREGEVDDTSRWGKRFPHAWLVSNGKTYDATLDLGKKVPEFRGLTDAEIGKKSPRITFK